MGPKRDGGRVKAVDAGVIIELRANEFGIQTASRLQFVYRFSSEEDTFYDTGQSFEGTSLASCASPRSVGLLFLPLKCLFRGRFERRFHEARPPFLSVDRLRIAALSAYPPLAAQNSNRAARLPSTPTERVDCLFVR